MTYTDAHGRPELVMHPAIKRAQASYRLGSGDAGLTSPAQAALQDGAGRTPSGAVVEAGSPPRR